MSLNYFSTGYRKRCIRLGMKGNNVFSDLLITPFTSIRVRSVRVYICKTESQMTVWASALTVLQESRLFVSPAPKQDHFMPANLRFMSYSELFSAFKSWTIKTLQYKRFLEIIKPISYAQAGTESGLHAAFAGKEKQEKSMLMN